MLFLATDQAPTMERVFRADPLNQFIAAPSVQQTTPEAEAGAILVAESDATRRGDADRALSLWSPAGVIVDENFSPSDSRTHHVWSGPDGLRERYITEFRMRHYLELSHLNLNIAIEDGNAIIVNDLDAIVQDKGAASAKRVHLPQSDRWFLRLTDGRWQIVRLELNRAPKGAQLAQKRDSP
jgi:hypothetical protein